MCVYLLNRMRTPFPHLPFPHCNLNCRRYDGTPLWDVRGMTGVHELVWGLNFLSFYFLYPSTFNILEVRACGGRGPACLSPLHPQAQAPASSSAAPSSAQICHRLPQRAPGGLRAHTPPAAPNRRWPPWTSPSCTCGRQASCASRATPRWWVEQERARRQAD